MPGKLPQTFQLHGFCVAVVKCHVDGAGQSGARRVVGGNLRRTRTVPGNRKRSHAVTKTRRESVHQVLGGKVRRYGSRPPASPSSPVNPIGEHRGLGRDCDVTLVSKVISPYGSILVGVCQPPASGQPVVGRITSHSVLRKVRLLWIKPTPPEGSAIGRVHDPGRVH